VSISPIASAFSSIYLGPALYDPAIGGVRQAERAEKAENARGAQKPESFWPAKEAGKPMSASGDLLDLSDEAKQLIEIEGGKSEKESSLQRDGSTVVVKDEKKSLGATQLSQEEQQTVSKLQARDAEVRIHESAHMAAAGPYATAGPSFTYETGPDGKKYAVGGEVSISTSPVKGDPQATLEKAQTIQRAALAPAEPSDQDRKVAAAAAQMAAEAQREIAQQKNDEAKASADEAMQSPAESQSSESAPSRSVFHLIREAAPKSTATAASSVSVPSSSPAARYAAQSRMSSGSFSAYA
jgi:hypothetical protein